MSDTYEEGQRKIYEQIYGDGKFVDALVKLPDGQIGYDAVKLAEIPTEGIFIKDYPQHVILVRTRNTLYQLFTYDGTVIGLASKPDGSTPRYLAEKRKINVSGSTWGGSMLKMGYIGIGMHLEFVQLGDDLPIQDRVITTSTIENIRIVERDGNDA
jgi:hypothetical protein